MVQSQKTGQYKLTEIEFNRLRRRIEMVVFKDAYQKIPSPQFFLANRESFFTLFNWKGRPLLFAFFSWILSEAGLNDPIYFAGYDDFILSQLPKVSLIYTRENALRVIYSFNNAQLVAEVFLVLSENRRFHHTKILRLGLLSFKGDKEQLIHEIMQHFDQLMECYQVAVMQMIALKGYDHYNEFFESLVFDKRDQYSLDLQCQAVRRLENTQSQRSEDHLYDLIEAYYDHDDWPLALVAIQVAINKGKNDEALVQLLKRAICSSNWHIRQTAARYLVAMNIDESQLQDVLNGQDKYALDAYLYAKNKAENKGNNINQ